MDNALNILVTFDLPGDGNARVKEVSDRIQLTLLPVSHAEEVPDEVWAETHVLYTQGILPDPDQVPNLQWVQFNSAGIDSFVDHPLVRNQAITATSMSGVITSQIAEYVVMTLLAFGQKLPKLLRYQHNRTWPSEKEKWDGLLPVELRNSTVGIIGYGSIGRQVARLLQPFGATVLAAKKDVMHPEDSGYSHPDMGDPHGDFFERLYPIEALHSLLKVCDFVVLTLPLTDSTQHILDAEAFDAMKSTAYLINVGRGGLIDQPALVQALQMKKIAGAALDVFEEEPLPEESPLWGMENVIISPHISGISRHLKEDTLSLFVENLNRFTAELPLYNQIDPEKAY